MKPTDLVNAPEEPASSMRGLAKAWRRPFAGAALIVYSNAPESRIPLRRVRRRLI